MSEFNLRTAEGMQQYCDYYEMGTGTSKKWALKHFGLIAGVLQPNEQVLSVFIGIYNYKSATAHRGNAAFVITDQRVIIAQQNLVGKSISSVAVDHINDVKLETGFFGGTVTFDAPTEKFNVFLNKEVAERVFEHARECINFAKNKKKEAPASNTDSHGINDLRELKQLYEEGIITKDEFDAKKKQILGI